MSAPSELPGVPPAARGSVPARRSAPRALVGLVRMNPAGHADELPVTGSSTAAGALGDASVTPPALLLTIEEAAERLQVGRCTMQALLLSGEVQSFKIGRLRRVPPAALDAYIRRRMAP
ncbi:MAG: helix-turn-helix domain-containing protein [Acidimicrobiales bacterium]|nr:helix-turn-helix domain-containing protein [Acidimicrobiales bacterium]